MVVASRNRIAFWSDGDWLPEIPVVRDANTGMDYVAGRKPNTVQIAWHDALGRCLVEARQDRCADSLWPGTKYVLLGNLSRLPDTVDPRSKKDMNGDPPPPRPGRGRGRRAPRLPDASACALPDVRPWYHCVFAPDLTWKSTIRLLIALRRAGVDLNTVELQ